MQAPCESTSLQSTIRRSCWSISHSFPRPAGTEKLTRASAAWWVGESDMRGVPTDHGVGVRLVGAC